MKAALLALPSVQALASEEDDEAVLNSPSDGDGFVVVFDPLDGSRNIEVSIPTGTIFGVYRCAAGTLRAVLSTIRFASKSSALPSVRTGCGQQACLSRQQPDFVTRKCCASPHC